ncbi:hypothetical protein KMP13_03995 [Epibacterium ulvae]|uniref:hypothetical protein n=1 Tax=Epibacterium ulvae TaxID=1156985 RepID=UPI001BFC203D|nr:hypothetical protein [Epibacterium ulvae]MBT8153065.1 hypothetical protein [Epibacterium ulvae]
MPTILSGTAYRIDGVELGSSDVISAGTSLTAVELMTVDQDANDFTVSPRSVLFEGSRREIVLSEAEEIDFFVDGAQIASESPSYEFVSLNTDAGLVFGITFSAGGDTYFLPRNDFAVDGITTVTADSQIRNNGVAFDQLDFGLTPPGATSFEGLVFGPGAIDAPGLGTTRTVIDTDDTPFNAGESTEINPFNAEVLVTVSFSDGSSISGVQAYQSGGIEFVNNQNIDTRAYALEVAAIEDAGYTLADIVGADFDSFTSHDLSYAEIGFGVDGVTPGEDPAPTPDPEPVPEVEENVILGTGGNDRLSGTSEADTFVFGSDADNGNRERDIITNFDASEDSIVLEAGAEIRRAFERNGDLHIQLEGDRDKIIIRDQDDSIVDDIVFVTDEFLG